MHSEVADTLKRMFTHASGQPFPKSPEGKHDHCRANGNEVKLASGSKNVLEAMDRLLKSINQPSKSADTLIK